MYGVAFSADGELFAAADIDHVIIFGRRSGRSWKVRQIIYLTRPQTPVSIAIAPDVGWIACAGDETIELFDMAKDGACIARLNACGSTERPSFTTADRQLITEFGTLALPGRDLAMPLSKESAWGRFHVCGERLEYDGQRVLWLPPSCRLSSCRAIHDNILAWSDNHGNVHYLAFDPSGMPDASNQLSTRTACGMWERPSTGIPSILKSALERVRVRMMRVCLILIAEYIEFVLTLIQV